MATEIKDALPQQEQLYPELDKVPFDSLKDKRVEILEYQLLPGAYGEFAVMKIIVDGKTVTTSRGSLIKEKLCRIDKAKYPIVGKVVEKKSQEGRLYLDLV